MTLNDRANMLEKNQWYGGRLHLITMLTKLNGLS